MSRPIHILTDRMIKAAAAKHGRKHDGGGLYFQTTDRLSTSWEYRYGDLTIKGKRRTMGLGPYPAIGVDVARERHKAAAALVAIGVDPLEAAKAKKANAIPITVWTVAASYEEYIKVKEKEWKTKRYAAQLRQKLNTYVKPVIGNLSIADIGLDEAERVLVPIWSTIRPTAERIQHHMKGVINWAIAKKHRTDTSNPFEENRLEFSLSFTKRKTTSFAALPFEQAPGFMAELRAQSDSVKKLALEFVLLTAVRVGDLAGGGKHESVPMLWSHVDMVAKLWTVPDTKMGHEHVVPLSDAAIAVLVKMQRFRGPDDFVFPGAVRGSVISDSTLRYLISDMGYAGQQTVHGCRSLFKTWAEETTDTDSKVIEAALAHSKQGVVKAYHRGSYLEKRRALMAAWADFLDGEAVQQLDDNVVALRA